MFKELQKGERLKLAYLHGGEVVNSPGEVLGPRMIADFELLYLIEGEINYVSDGAEFTVAPGGAILGRPGLCETYFWNSRMPTRHAYFHFDIDCMPEDWPVPSVWPQVRSPSVSPLCESLFRQILQRMGEHDEWSVCSPGRSACLLVEALIDLFIKDEPSTDAASFERDRPEPVRRALVFLRRIVEEDPFRPLTLGEVARQAYVTEKHLCRLFSSSLGHSPMQTFTLLKLQSARPLLLRTNLSIKQVAERCGFENPLYFSRCFSKNMGCSPSGFRRRSGVGVPVMLPMDLLPRMRF